MPDAELKIINSSVRDRELRAEAIQWVANQLAWGERLAELHRLSRTPAVSSRSLRTEATTPAPQVVPTGDVCPRPAPVRARSARRPGDRRAS
jgi:hypothetical protein